MTLTLATLTKTSNKNLTCKKVTRKSKSTELEEKVPLLDLNSQILETKIEKWLYSLAKVLLILALTSAFFCSSDSSVLLKAS